MGHLYNRCKIYSSCIEACWIHFCLCVGGMRVWRTLPEPDTTGKDSQHEVQKGTPQHTLERPPVIAFHEARVGCFIGARSDGRRSPSADTLVHWGSHRDT